MRLTSSWVNYFILVQRICALSADESEKAVVLDSALNQPSKLHGGPSMYRVGVDAKGNVESGADNADKDKAKLIRKQAFPVHTASEGENEMPGGPFTSTPRQPSNFVRSMVVDAIGNVETPRQSSNLVRSMVVDEKGNIETGADSKDKATGLDKSSEMGGAKFLAEHGDERTQPKYAAIKPVAVMPSDPVKKNVQSVVNVEMPALVRKNRSPDATRSDLFVSLIAELTNSSERGTMLRDIAILLHRSDEHVDNAFQIRSATIAAIGVISLVCGCLVVTCVERNGISRAMKFFVPWMVVTRSQRARNAQSTIDSGRGESSDGFDGFEESSEEDEEFSFNIRTSLPSQMVARTGLLWKLERRFIDDLINHTGSSFEVTDRFAYLESWDLRFFSLDVDEGAVLCTYVSALNAFASVVFEVQSIERDMIKIPSLKAGPNHTVRRGKRSSTGTVTHFYDDYLACLRNLGYEPPENSTRDPDTLSVFILTGRRQGEEQGTRSVGRISWKTSCDMGTAEELSSEHKGPEHKGPELTRMCLGSANRKECQRWHNEIKTLLTKVRPQESYRKRSSDLARRVQLAAAEARAAEADALNDDLPVRSKSSFVLDVGHKIDTSFPASRRE